MREVKTEGGTIRLKGAAYTVLAYQDAFGAGDAYRSALKVEDALMRGVVPDPVEMLRLAYALAATADPDIEPYEVWVRGLEAVDLIELASACIAEATAGFLWGRATPPAPQEGQKRQKRAGRAAAAGHGTRDGQAAGPVDDGAESA